LVLEEGSPGRALDRLNRVTLSSFGSRIATVIAGVLDTASGAVVFSSAGHLSPVCVGVDEALELPVPPGPPLGVQLSSYKDHEFQIEDQGLVLFTDGLVERRGTHIDTRLAQLERTLRAAAGNHPEVMVDAAIADMTADAKSADDIVVLVAQRHDRTGGPLVPLHGYQPLLP
jgi:serine phosphatase RsbU (regulator of sigma subunit)